MCAGVCAAGGENRLELELELMDVRVLDVVATATIGRRRRAKATVQSKGRAEKGPEVAVCSPKKRRKQIGDEGGRGSRGSS